jgi:hypothetical protein
MWGSNNKKSFKAAGRKSVNMADAEKLWTEIADEGNVASMEGISVLCEKLDLDPLEDVRVLVLLWKMDASSKPAQITKDEWMRGCERLQVDSVEKFQDLLPSLEPGFLDNDEFKDFYKVSPYMKGFVRFWSRGITVANLASRCPKDYGMVVPP